MISDPQIGISMLILFIFVIMLGFPIAFTLMAIGVSFGFYAYYVPGQEIFANRVFTLLVQKTFEVASNDVLIAVPVFTFMATSSTARTSWTACSMRCSSPSAACLAHSRSSPWSCARCGALHPGSLARLWS